MKRFAVAWLLGFVVVTACPAQEAASSGPETQQAERGEQRSRPRERRPEARTEVTVADPDGYRMEGEPVFSGPQPGEKVVGFQATSLAGENKGQAVDPIAAADRSAQVLFFQDDTGVAIRGLLGVVDAIEAIDQKADADLQVVCVFLSDDPDAIAQRFARAFPIMQRRGVDVIAVSKDGRDGPGAYGLNRNIAQTIILAKDGKVTRNFVFRQGLLYLDPHVMGGIAELVDEDRETVAKWLAEASENNPRMRMRRSNAPPAGR